MSTAVIDGAAEVLKQILTEGEKIKNDAPQKLSSACSSGDAPRQGDIYVTFRDALPSLDEIIEVTPYPQLAPGETLGSQHRLRTLDGVRMFHVKNASPYDGPVLLLDTPNTIEHPKHGYWDLEPGCYCITYQRTVDSEQKIRRSED